VPLLKRVKEGVEKLTGLGRPFWREVEKAVRLHKPRSFNFDDDGLIPNSPLPLVIYRGVVCLTETNDLAVLFEVLFAPAAGKDRGAMVFTISRIFIPAPMKFWASHGKVLGRFGGVRGRVIELGPVT
jgi:hypothetical protein